MSKATKRKHVTREVMEEYILPEGNQQILKILGGRGNNLHEAQTSEGDKFLISMPTRFRKNVWIKRGDYVMADPIEEGDKVKAEIIGILYPKQIKYIKQEGLWPVGFDGKPSNDSNGIHHSKDDNIVEELTNQLNNASVKENNDGGSQGDAEDNRAYEEEEEEEEDSEDNDDDLFVNTNRPTVTYYYTDESSEEEEEDEEGDDDGDEEEDGEEDNKLKGCVRQNSEEGWIGK